MHTNRLRPGFIKVGNIYGAGSGSVSSVRNAILVPRITLMLRIPALRSLSAPHPELALAAARAVRQWRYSPVLLDGRAVEVVFPITVALNGSCRGHKHSDPGGVPPGSLRSRRRNGYFTSMMSFSFAFTAVSSFWI
jgi:hypothetical protein